MSDGTAAVSGPLPMPQGPRVLVVDDSDDICGLVSLVLRRAHFDVVVAKNGLEGVIAAHTVRPALILMDMAMPVLDGLEATRLLKAGSATRDVPVIAHTSVPGEPLESGLFATVLTKPVAPGALVSAVEAWTRGRPASAVTAAISE